jgi:8-oxo-dGTP diphosphatase
MKAKLIVKGTVIDRSKGKILLLQRSSADAEDAGSWENPGGKIEVGETLEAALRREVHEEAGIEVEIRNLAYVTYVGGDEPVLFIVYSCEPQSSDVSVGSEHQAFIWADKAMCKKLVSGGIAKDFSENGVYEMSWTDEAAEQDKTTAR